MCSGKCPSAKCPSGKCPFRMCLVREVHSETCFMKNRKSIIDLILTNKPLHFQKMHVVETGLSDCHKMISTFFKACSSKLKTKVIYYRSYKKFNESDFLCSLNKANFDFFKNDPNQNYNLLTDKFLGLANKHAPLKKKFVRGNNAPFMNREFQKEIYVRSRLRNKYWVEPSAENKAAYKKQRNKCVKIRRKSIKRYMDKISEKGIETNKSFWNFIKPFMTNKGMISNKDITLIDGKNVITDEYELSQIFNKVYINIVEKSCGNKPNKIGTTLGSLNDSDVIDRIIKSYQNHPSVLKIKNKFGSDLNSFDFQQIKAPEVKKLLKEIDIKKAVGVDTIPPKLIKISADIIAEPLTQAINCCLRQGIFPENAKVASIVPLDKGKPDKYGVLNYRPLSILNAFSKIYEKVIKNQLASYLDKYFSPFISAYRKSYSTQQVLIRLLEEWREKLDKNFIVGAVLMDLSKAFDCIPHDLIIAKLAAYGFKRETLRLIYSYLKGRKQCVKINNTYSDYDEIISGVPQGSILGPVFFNLSINDLFFFIEKASMHNFADDNTLSAWGEKVSKLIDTLESESNIAIDWFTKNEMIIDPDKFQAIILDKKKSNLTNIPLTVDNQTIKSVPSVELLGIHLDDKLNFNLHISNICRSAANQLNALIRLKNYLSFNAKRVLINSYIISNFNYCPLVRMFSTAKSLNKIESLQKRALRFLYNDYSISYEGLLEKAGKIKMNVYRLRNLCVEIYKTINKLNPEFMNNIFKVKENKRVVREQYKLNLETPE